MEQQPCPQCAVKQMRIISLELELRQMKEFHRRLEQAVDDYLDNRTLDTERLRHLRRREMQSE